MELLHGAPGPKLPTWLPLGVAHEVQRILDIDFANVTLVLRLATDERMRAVWRELSKRRPPQTPPQVSKSWSTVMKDRVNVQLPQSSDALVLFFWVAYTIADAEHTVGTFATNNVTITQYNLLGARLREAAARFRLLKLEYGEIIQFATHSADRHAAQAEDAAYFCDEIVNELHELNNAEAALVVHRLHGNREARGFVRLLAVDVQKLFGTTALYRTLARVASVALMKEVTAIQVRKWCDSLDF